MRLTLASQDAPGNNRQHGALRWCRTAGDAGNVLAPETNLRQVEPRDTGRSCVKNPSTSRFRLRAASAPDNALAPRQPRAAP